MVVLNSYVEVGNSQDMPTHLFLSLPGDGSFGAPDGSRPVRGRFSHYLILVF
jgi:hypothetical protein